MMRTTFRLLLALALVSGLAAAVHAADAAKVHDAHTAFEALKSLEGTWTGTVAAEQGGEGRETTIVYEVSAAGHSVIATFAPGQPHEMFSVYHMNGDELLMTHYCAIGNAPKMKFVEGEAGAITMAFAGGTNFDPAKDAHAHEGTLRIVDENRLESMSTGWADGKPSRTQYFSLERVTE